MSLTRRPEEGPNGQEQNQETSSIVFVNEVLKIINRSSLLSVQKETLKRRVLEISEHEAERQRISEEETRKQRIESQEDLEIALGIPPHKTEGMSLEEREKLLLPRIEESQEELEGALEIKRRETEDLDLQERRELVFSRIEDLINSNEDNESKIEELEAKLKAAIDPNLVVQAIVEGWLNIPIVKLDGKDRTRLEQEISRIIPGFTLTEV